MPSAYFGYLYYTQIIQKELDPYGNIKTKIMGTLLNFRNLYLEAFDNCKPEFLVVLLKIYSVFSALMIFTAVYALVYRAFTGFEF